VITETYTKTHTRFSDGNGQTFRVLAKYNPNEENDPWVKYINEATNQEYTCRMEAFLARFSVAPEETR
jgi:triacylglycerol esterase/lipase EstA (alpha/beta hydrolase family)